MFPIEIRKSTRYYRFRFFVYL